MNAPEPTDALAQIRQLSDQIAQLYALLEKNSEIRAQILQDADAQAGVPGYEAWRSQLEATLPEREYLGQEISRRVNQIADLQRTRDSQRNAVSGDSDVEEVTDRADAIVAQDVEQEFRLGQELLDLASAQIEAVKRWNEDPSAARLTTFQAEYSALWEQYRAVLAKLHEVRAQRRSGGSAADQAASDR